MSLHSSTLASPAAHERATLTGVACGLGAGAAWGGVFLAPELVRGFSPLALTAGRFLCYGLLAAAMLAGRWRPLLESVSRQQWRELVWLALTGNTLYYVLLSSAVQLGGIAMTSLVVGFVPVAVTVIGSRERGAVPLRRLLPSLLLCVAGVLCIAWQSLGGPDAPGAWGRGRALLGLCPAVGALACWTAYTVSNARSLRRLGPLTAHDWNLLVGIVTGVQGLALAPLAWAGEAASHSAAAWGRLGAVCLALSILASLLGNALWHRMSRLLPLTLIGQMILFETVFALLYGLLWEWRLPTWLEVAALACVAGSVLACLTAHRQAPVPDPAGGAKL